MKNLMKILVSLLFVLILFSCEMTTRVNSRQTFIVDRIERQNPIYSKYYSSGHAYYCLEMPTGWYNVGDTIKLIPTKFCKEIKEDI